jgi:autotransporter-associated beta strand protein
MQTTKITRVAYLVGAFSLIAAMHLPARADIYTWEGDVSSDMADNGNWVGSPAVDFITGDDQWVFGSSLGSVTPQLGPGDGESISWVGQTTAGSVDTAILFDAGAPAYTFGNGGDTARGIGLWTTTSGSANVVNNSANTQTFNVLVRERIATIDAAAGDIAFNGEFRVGDASSSTAYNATFQGDHNIYLNGTVTGYTGGTTASQQNNRSRVFYEGATTSTENAGKLILGDIGNTFRGKFIIGSQKGGAVVATNNNSFGDSMYVSGGTRDTFIGSTSGGNGALSNGVVEIDGTAGDLSIAEHFRGETRMSDGVPHMRNVAGNNTISGYVIPIIDGGIAASGADAFILESASGTLRITGGIGQNIQNQTVNLYLQGNGNGEVGFGGDGSLTGLSDDYTTAFMNVTKRGNGTWTNLAGTPNTYRGTTTISGGKYIVNGTHNFDVNPVGLTGPIGDYTVEAGGTLGGSGTIISNVNLTGVLAPGSSVGTFTIGGLNLTGGTLAFELNSTDHTAGSGINDLIVSTGALNLSGGATLNVTGIGGNLTAGDYDLIQFAGALTGTAANITLGTIPLGAGLSASIVIDADSVNLHVGAGLHAGDFDGDGDVDGADFVAWQTNFPTATGATLAQGDADGDGDVDGADFVVWQTNFPFTPGPGASPVPEPAGVLLFALGIAGVFVGVSRRRILARS